MAPPVGWELTLIVVLLPLAAWSYERAYHAVTGQSFLDYYLGARIALEGSTRTPWPFPLDKVDNADVVHRARGVVCHAVEPGRRRRRRAGDASPVDARPGRLGAFCRDRGAGDHRAGRGAGRQGRPLRVPRVLLCRVGGLIVACARWPRVATWADGLDRMWPWGPAVLWLALVGGRILT